MSGYNGSTPTLVTPTPDLLYQLGQRNRVINGAFSINQRAVSGTVSVGAYTYAHDRWRGGDSGCTYTFATSENLTTITITAGSLVQVVEGATLQSGAHTLSWGGSVGMKINGGAAGVSGMQAVLTGGADCYLETVGTGTLNLVQLERGGVITPFEFRDDELRRCRRYYIGWSVAANKGPMSQQTESSGTGLGSSVVMQFENPLRTTPAASGYFNASAGGSVSGAASIGGDVSPNSVRFGATNRYAHTLDTVSIDAEIYT
ncbi:hypothetical protein [Maritimibacter sp. DP1N21-5]|uniref:hypothetical protein n=1 Tax=Maritimibacter sp. DP1N21-5 TaxID=2836867 RepID=UPI001C45C41D|nr:hypothetical protein [Maritimibacter sp. DP1N21-5]MBV7408776.1 hypothetical protein [Maritimibacter sp. DP1N21-5]